jgi:DNA repair protein RadC
MIARETVREAKPDSGARSDTLQPRERLFVYGPAALSDEELLSVLLGWGTRGKPVRKLAGEVLALVERTHGSVDLDALLHVVGLGHAKAASVAAALELARRLLCPKQQRITFPADVIPLISHYSDRKQEHFLCLSLNGAHEVSAIRVVSVGLVNRTVVHPREVYADALMDRAAAVIVAHNHPSGNVEPSAEDRDVTARLKAAGETLGVRLLDHIIFSARGYYSFLEKEEV